MAHINDATLMPPAFEDGLDVYSSGDGTPGAPVYQGASNAALVAADQDFGGCLELVKTLSIQKLRYTGETPLLPGRYLRISARVKAVSGNLPSVRVAGWAGAAGGARVTGLTETGPAVALSAYGKVITVEAVVGTGARPGVDLIWGTTPVYGHFGLDLTGPDGGVVRIDDLRIEDITSHFVRDLVDVVDVKDYGAMGDGVTDDAAAFAAADAAAQGRSVLVSDGVFRVDSSLSMNSRVRFQGRMLMPADAVLGLTRNFDLPSYIEAFKDEQLAFRKAFQALLNFVDHEGLDMGGRRIDLDGPLDMQAAVATRDSWAIRRVIRNGQINAVESPAWAPEVVTAQASYSAADPLRLTGVSNVSAIAVGSLVEGQGVGREVYVQARNAGAGTLTLSQPLFAAEGTQSYTFTRFKYLLDFSGFSHLAKFELADIEFQMDGRASGIMLPPDGLVFHVRDCYFTKPANRGITSIGRGCQGMLIDRCNWLSDEQDLPAQDRTTIAFNTNGNDVKLRNNRAVKFRHFGVMNGSGHIVLGNHWFQGDNEPAGLRLGGLVLTKTNVKTMITANYIDNNFVEWTNEHDARPEQNAELSFGGLTITANNFTSIGSAPWFNFLVVKPHGPGHFIHGLNMSGNVFKATNGAIDRVERVDDSIAPLDLSRMRNITVEGNTFNGVGQMIANPVTLNHNQATVSDSWTVQTAGYLPFGGRSRTVEGITINGSLRNAANVKSYPGHYVSPQQGAQQDEIQVSWETPVKGKLWVVARMDNPL